MAADPAAAPTGAPLREAKQILRARIVGLRDALDAGTRTRASAAIAGTVASLESFRRAHTVLLFASFGSEWQTRPVLEGALALGKRVVLPRVDRSARVLRLQRVADLGRDLAPGVFGIPEPLPRCETVPHADIDWVLVPGLGFDRAGRRLGYGGGYYDRMLPTLPARAPRVAAAYSIQVVDEVPSAPHDVEVDALVTERGLEFERARPA